MKQKISLFSLVLLIVAAIDSIRVLPTTAIFGSALVVYYLIGAVVFLIPVAFISAEFASRYPEQGGVFHWIRSSLGNRMGVLAIWLQWINTMVWYPTMLLFIAGTMAYLLKPQFAENPWFLMPIILAIFWGLIFVNSKGVQVSTRITSFCVMVGTLIPMILLIILGIAWVVCQNPLSFTWDTKIFHLQGLDHGGILMTILASFLGIELAGVQVTEVHNPQKNYPRAIGYTVLILLFTLILGSLSVAAVVPKESMHFVDGVMQSFTAFLHAFHLPYLVPLLACLMIIGSIGGSVNWLLSPAQGLLQAGESGFLPKALTVKNPQGVPVRILNLQGIIVTLFCFGIQWMPSVNTYYWFLMTLSTILYLMMYVLLFIAALKLKRPESRSMAYKIPKGVRTMACLFGLLGALSSIFFAFRPTPEVPTEMSSAAYAAIVGIGLFLMLLPVPVLWLHQALQRRSLLAKTQ